MMSKRLFIVSNRLPFYAVAEGSRPVLLPSQGGLVSAVQSFIESQKCGMEIVWAGSPGCDATEWLQLSGQSVEFRGNFLPVLLEKKQYEGYYNGFSNSTLWPVFHSLLSYTVKDPTTFRDYVSANEAFADTLLKHVLDNDVVWIHDYHLFPLAGMLRRKRPGLRIGFFLHTPFPPPRLLNVLPLEWQRTMLDSVATCDHIAFQTAEDRKYFLQAMDSLHLGIDEAKVSALPVGIDAEKFEKGALKESVAELRAKLRERLENQKVIFSVDRLDYTKGLYHRLKSYQYFLESNPHYIGKVVFLMVVFPSIRKNSAHHEESKALVESCLKQMNLRFGNVKWQPVVYFHQNLSFEELLAFYTSADVALITPLKDGLNLVAKEFVASRTNSGVLIISKNAGASNELKDALIADPYRFADVASALRVALEMTPSEQKWRMERLKAAVKANPVKQWGAQFLQLLDPGSQSAAY